MQSKTNFTIPVAMTGVTALMTKHAKLNAKYCLCEIHGIIFAFLPHLSSILKLLCPSMLK
jgi:hypothetical protein